MKSSFPLALLLSSLALAGCETTVDLPEPPHTPRVTLLHTLSTAPQDSTFRELYAGRQLYISNSQRVFDQTELPGRPDATVELRDAANAVVERYRPVTRTTGFADGPGYYRPVLGFQPQPGETYTLRASLPGLETAESTLTMPRPAVVESATFVPRELNAPEDAATLRGQLNVVLRDEPGVANYYVVYAQVLDQQAQGGQWSTLTVDNEGQNSDVPLGTFQLSEASGTYALYPFSDAGLDGQRLALSNRVRAFYQRGCPGSVCPEAGYVEVRVSSITKQAYDFYLSRQRYFDSDGNPFAEPAPLASNVRAGYGLFGGATDVISRIPLR